MKKKYPPEEFTADVMPVNHQEMEDFEEWLLTERQKSEPWAEFEAEMRMLNAENDFLNYK